MTRISCWKQGPTWQQAVQWMQEVHVWPKMVLRLTAKHDTYGITFQYRHVPGELQTTHVPLKVGERGWICQRVLVPKEAPGVAIVRAKFSACSSILMCWIAHMFARVSRGGCVCVRVCVGGGIGSAKDAMCGTMLWVEKAEKHSTKGGGE